MSTLATRDLRAGGRWSLAQAAKNAAIRLAIRALLALADRLPARVLFALCRGAAGWVRLAAPSLERRARDRARAALPEAEARRVARECFVNAGTSLAISLLLRRPGVRASSFVRIGEAAKRELADAAGAVVVSAHLGPFELVAPAVAELGLPTAIVVRESYDPELDVHVDAHRVSRGVTVIHRGDPGAAARIVRALRSGALLGVLPDLPARVASVPVDFLGERVALPSGPARVARSAEVPLLVCCLEPLAEAPGFSLAVSRLEPGNDSVERMTQRVATALSEAILRAPEWWLWMAG